MMLPSLLRRAEKALRRRLGARRFHAYCVGAAKTGTTSLSRFLARHYLAAHEPETVRTNRLVIEYVRGDVGDADARLRLLARDRRLGLEFDSSHPLGYVAPLLQEIFPHARFIVTIREPYSWLRSRVNFHNATDPPQWREYRQFFWHGHNDGYAPEEAVLEREGLVSLDTYLAQYADHYRRLVEGLDWSRVLLLRTHELSESTERIGRFLDIRPETLTVTHAKRGRSRSDLLDSIDEGFVRDRIFAHCEDLLERWFPERLGDYR